LDELNLSSFTKTFGKNNTKYSIIEFAEKKSCLDIKLLPQQRFLLKIFDKCVLDDTVKDILVKDKFGEHVLFSFTEKGFYEFLYKEGRISLDYDTYMNTDIVSIVLCAGRGATKTTTISLYTAYKLYEILCHYCPQDYFGILSHDSIDISIISLGEANATELFGRLNNLITKASFFKPYILSEPLQGELRIWTQADLDKIKGFLANPPAHSNSLKVSAKPCTPGLRGANRSQVILEEIAFFNNSASSTREIPLDEQIYRAVTPSVARFKYPDNSPFGKVLMISSPGAKTGKFYNAFESAFKLGTKSGSLAIHAPTWYLNSNLSKAFYISEYNSNPKAYQQEYAAEFGNSESTWIPDDRPIFRAFDTSLNQSQPYGRVDHIYFAGFDFAFSGDGSASAISHFEKEYVEIPENFVPEVAAYYPDLMKELEENNGKILSPKYVVDYFEVRYAGQGIYEHYPVMPVEGKDGIIDWVLTLYKRYQIRIGIFDQFSGAVLTEIFQQKGLRSIKQVPHTAQLNDAHYKNFLFLLNSNLLKMAYSPEFMKELKSLRESRVGSGYLKVDHPAGGHNDLFSAVIRSLYLCWAYVTKNKNVISNMGILYSGGDFKSSILNSGKVARHLENIKNGMHNNHGSLRNPKNMFPNRMK